MLSYLSSYSFQKKYIDKNPQYCNDFGLMLDYRIKDEYSYLFVVSNAGLL